MVGPAEKHLLLAGLVFGVSKHKEAQQISASISARWEPDGIFAYHRSALPWVQTTDSISRQRSHWHRAESLNRVRDCGRIAEHRSGIPLITSSKLVFHSRADRQQEGPFAIAGEPAYPLSIDL
jgi:hypothetical protein